jgi:hypothetical protein
MTLPLVSSVSVGKAFTIKKISTSTSNALTIAASGSDTIDSASSFALVSKNSSVTVFSDCTNWQVNDFSDKWRVDANIVGAKANLGTAAVSSYTGVENGSLSLTNNSGNSILTAQIPCSGTNSPSGTTCAAGNESVGVSFTLPRAGDVMACASFIWFAQNSATSTITGTFEVVETPTNAQTISQEGNSRVGAVNNTASAQLGFPYRVCGTLSFATAGQKVLRLMYEQGITNMPSQSLFIADGSSVDGQRDVHWEVYPISK